MQNATTIYHERIGRKARFHPQGQVFLQFLFQPVLNVTGGHELTVLAKERRIVYRKEHTHSRLIHGYRRKGLRIFEVSYGIANLESVYSYHCTDIATVHFFHRTLAKPLKDHKLLDLLLLYHIVTLAQTHLLTSLKGTSGNLTHCDTSHIRTILQ